MTDRETLFLYRLKQAEETLIDAEKMLSDNINPRSITNRAYYTMFYALLALFLKTGMNIKTSKHTGVISLFDKEFVKTGKFDKYYSKILHQMFDARLEGDYRELIEIPTKDAEEHVKLAKEFLQSIKKFTDKCSTQDEVENCPK